MSELFLPRVSGLILSFALFSFYDIKTGKIPNRLLLLTAVYIILTYFISIPVFSFRASALFLIVISLMCVLFAAGAAGGADIKMMMLIWLCFPSEKGLLIFVFSLFYAGVFSLFLLFRRKIFIKRMKHLISYIRDLKYKTAGEYYVKEKGSAAAMPLAPPFFLGILTYAVCAR